MNHHFNKIVYLGYNSFKDHKRGVENVIEFQSKAYDFKQFYYIHWGKKTYSYKYEKFICISIKNCWYWPIVLNFVLLKLRKEKEYLMHSHNFLFTFFSVINTDIFTVHDGLYYLNKNKKRKIKFLFYIIEKLTYFRCSKVHFISKFTKDQTLFDKRTDYVIIPNSSHFEHFAQKIDKLKNNNEEKLILIVRSIEERARFDLLIQVAEKLANSNFKFTVAGKGPLLEYYKNEIRKKKLNNVKLLGYVKDEKLLQLYKECDLVLMLAEYGEGFGLPIIEGYLFNKPVIASNKCAIPEVIISQDFLFENNEEEIIEKIQANINIENIKFRDYYYSKFSNTIILSQIRSLYQSIFS